VANRLLEPVDALRVERLAARERLVDRQRLVVVDHDLDTAADARANGPQRRDVLLERLVAEAQLHGREAAREELLRLVGELRRLHEPEAVAVVRADRRRRTPEHRAERFPRRDRKRVPGRDVVAGERHAHDPLDADEREAFRQRRELRLGIDALALHETLDLGRDPGDAHRGRTQVAEEIRAPCHAFFRLEVDQHERRGANHRAARAERVVHRDFDGRAAKRADGEGGKRHG
jgi:hypothetical protein